MNLNGKQIISIAGAILSVLTISTAQLTDLFGTGVAKELVSIAGLINTILQSTMAALTSQGSTINDVLAMPGIQNIDVGAKANKTLAMIATDPTQSKIGPTPEANIQVNATAKA